MPNAQLPYDLPLVQGLDLGGHPNELPAYLPLLLALAFEAHCRLSMTAILLPLQLTLPHG